ncbi:MAG TPA: DMT family transporter [Ktedonobacterales bacterium]|nr:DMT family transporter [Ktedonobacterales bacterium]
MRTREYLMLFTLALIWGASFFFIKIGLRDLAPASLVVGRLAGSVVVLGAIAAARPAWFTGWWRYWRLIVVLAVANYLIPYLLIAWGETRIASGLASIFNATTPLFTVVLASQWRGAGREPLTAQRVAGVLLGFIGVAVLVGPAVLGTVGDSLPGILGEAAVLIAAASYGVGALVSRSFRGAPRLVGPLGSQLAALVMTLPVAAVWSPPTRLPGLPALGAVLELGVFGTAVAFLLFFWLVNHVGSTRASIVTYLLPCTALLWGALLLGEPVTWFAIAGLALVLLGSVITNGTLNGLFTRATAARERTPASEAA